MKTYVSYWAHFMPNFLNTYVKNIWNKSCREIKHTFHFQCVSPVSFNGFRDNIQKGPLNCVILNISGPISEAHALLAH
jgi:hypothetical protein